MSSGSGSDSGRCLSLSLSIYLSIYLSVCQSASLKMKLSCETSSLFARGIIKNTAILRIFLLDNRKNKTSLRDFLNFGSWQHQKQSNSARLPSKMESWVQSWRPRANAFAISPLHLSKVLRLPLKSEARSYEVLHLSHKIILPNPKIWCSKCNLSQEISARTS